jgi:cell division protein FtsN
MAQRDYKPKGGAVKGKSRGGTIIGIVIGLVLGLAIAVAVAVFLNKGTKPFADKTGRDKPPATKGQDKASDPNAPLYGKDARAAAEAKKDGKDDDRFSFYKILPGEEQAKAGQTESKKDPAKILEGKDTKDSKAADAPKAADAKTADAPKVASASREQYFLQAGSFSSAGDADNQKAKLALMGFEAKVEATEVDGKGTFHRVRLGPYGRLDDINRVRATLAQNGVDASLIKMKDPQ